MFHGIALILLLGLTEAMGDDRIYYKQLRDKLLGDKNYDTSFRPVKDIKALLTIKTASGIARLMNVDIHRGHVEIDLRMYMSWKDDYLVWDPAKFGNITKMQLHPEEIWTPEILSEHRHYLIHGDSYWSFPLMVNSNGTVAWRRSLIFPLRCDINLASYPADVHQCSASIFLKHYLVEKLRFDVFTEYKRPITYSIIHFDNPEFAVDYVNSSIVNETLGNTTIVDHFWSIRMEIQRRTSAYMYKVVIPYIAANLFMLYALVVIGPLGVRILTAVVALNIDMNLFSYMWYVVGTPSQYGVPYAVKCVTINMTLVVVFIVLIILSDHFVAHTRTPCPNWLRNLARNEILNKVLFFHVSFMELKDLDVEAHKTKKTIRASDIGDWTMATIFLNRLYLIAFLVSFLIYHL